MKQVPRPIADDEITFTDIYVKVKEWSAYLWKRKVWILIVSAVFAAVGYLKVTFSKPAYTATLTFSLEQGGGKGSNLAGLASQFGFTMGGDGGGMFSGENLLTLMKSRRLVEDVLLTPVEIQGDSILLIDQYVKTWPELKERWDSTGLYPFNPSKRNQRLQDSALGVIHHAIVEKAFAVTKQDEALSFVSLSYTGHDENFSGSFVEQIAKHATDFYIESKTANNKANIAKLQERVDSVSAEMQIAMVGYASAQDQNSFTVQSTAKVPSVQKQMKVTMLTTLYGELVKNLELSKTMSAREEPLITIIDRPHYPLRIRESKLKSALFGGVLGGFLTVMFFAGREFLRDLNEQAASAKPKA